MNKKGAMLPSEYIISIIVFTLFIMGGLGIISAFVAEEPSFINDERYSSFNKTFNTYSDIQQKTADYKSTIEDADTDFGAFGVLNSLISTAWNSLKLILSSFTFMTVVFNGLHTFFGIPEWVSGLILSAITISLIFAIFAAIFQREV